MYQWNVWGTDNVGKITANGDKFFYLKDHLGTIRVVLDASNNIVSAQDFDAWGYPLEGRSYQSDNTDYKFTGKQRDTETGWDYFGARYYDARIGRWGGVEPLLEKYLSYTSYQYGLLNPMKLVDADGLDLYVGGDKTMALVYLKSLVSTDDAKRITVDDNGMVSFNTEGLNINQDGTFDDAAFDLLNNLVQSKNSYLFEVTSETQYFERDESDSKVRGNERKINIETEKDPQTGVLNLSEEEKMNGYSAKNDFLPKNGFNGQVSLGKGHWNFLDGSWQPKTNIIFHELSECYYRTDKKLKHTYPNPKKKGAHEKAIDDANRFKKQKGNAGEGIYVPYKN